MAYFLRTDIVLLVARFYAAKVLVQQGYHVILLCRNERRGEKARAKLSSIGSVQLEIADLADLESVAAFCDRLRASGVTRISALINNAGLIHHHEQGAVSTCTPRSL